MFANPKETLNRLSFGIERTLTSGFASKVDPIQLAKILTWSNNTIQIQVKQQQQSLYL